MYNFYEILGVNEDASPSAIKKAYFLKALSEHPDKGGDAEKMGLLIQAYESLRDPIERKKFDEDWDIFRESYDTEIHRVPLDCLPSAGVAFSMAFRQQHAEFIKQCQQNPLAPNPASFHLKDFCSDLYSDNDNTTDKGTDDVFSFIKAKPNLPTKLDVEPLTPKMAVRYFLKFLKGDYARNELRDLSKAFYTKLKQLEIVGQQAGHEFQLYYGIYEIFLISVKEKTPTEKILFSLLKITEFAKRNTAESIRFTAPLFQNKYFRSLFFKALRYYWLSGNSKEGALDGSYTEAFNGQAGIERLIEDLKSKLSKNRRERKSNYGVVKALRQARLLLKLEEDLSETPDQKTDVNKTNIDVGWWGRIMSRIESKTVIKTTDANFYREKAFHLLDWLPAIVGFAGRAIAANTLLQTGLTLQKAAEEESNILIRMADEKLAANIYDLAVSIAHLDTPDIELYACLHSVKCLLYCKYTDSCFKEILEGLQSRLFWLADLFPFFQAPQSNADFIDGKNNTLDLMRQFLHSLVARIDDPEDGAIVIDHSYARVFYQAHEACLKNWYQDSHDLELEKKIRQRLMQELLDEKKWARENVNYNLNAPWPLADLDEGWTCLASSILPSAKETNTPTYKTIHGFELNYKTGEIAFILDFCQESESDYNRLLTLTDLCELISYGLTSAIFSLDPADSDMQYHPFNKIYFKPSTLFGSQLLHTMFITDYLLKFLTVGQEVQRREPYGLRSLDNITSQLPDHLKKVIQDFHTSSHEESINRFWIESEAVRLAVGDGSQEDSFLFAFDKNSMVVKHRKMKRDVEGKLVDTNDKEGWDCYILTQKQTQELFNGKRSIADSALIIVKGSWELIIFENQRVTYRFPLEEGKHDLILLSERERDTQEKIKTKDSESVRQIYRIILKVAEKTGVPHRYSPEFIFAQEFTKYYDEFAIYFPEFGRLRELSKAVALVTVMANRREINKEEISLIRKRLNYATLTTSPKQKQREYPEEYQYWLKIEQELKKLVREAIMKQIEEWRSKCSKEKLDGKKRELLQNIRQQMDTLKFTKFSPEIKKICDAVFSRIRSDVIAEYGYSGWNSVSHQVYEDAVEPHIPKFIADLETQKRTAYLAQLSELFAEEFAELSTFDANRLLYRFFDGNDIPLREQLVRYGRRQVAREIKKIYPEHTIDSLDEALNNYSPSVINDIVNVETGKAVKRHQQQLQEILIGRKKTEQSFLELGFGADIETVDLEGTCSWVPASFRHVTGGGHNRSVYGGVSLTGWIKDIKKYANPKDVAALLRQTTKKGTTVQQNKVWGNAVADWYREKVVRKQFDSSKYEVIDATNFKVKTPLGGRKWDTIVRRKSTGEIVEVIENKTGKSRNRRQEKIDLWAYKNELLQNPVALVKLAPEIRPRTWSF